jgi:putative transposase
MPAALSLDLRQRALKALDSGHSFAAVAQRFDISHHSLRRWKKLHEQNGSLEPRPRPGNRAARKLTDELRQVVLAWLDAEPDLILPHIAQRLLEQYNLSITPSQLSRTLLALGYTRKKTARSTRAASVPTSREND